MKQVIALTLLLISSPALASQPGVVLKDTDVHQYPNETSPQIGRLTQGLSVKLSSNLTRDIHQLYWYKVVLPSGEMGYVRSSAVKAKGLDKDFKAGGMSPVVTPAHTPAPE